MHHSACDNALDAATATTTGATARASVADLQPGQRAAIKHIWACGALRQRLLDMGILPRAVVALERIGLGGDPLWISCQGAHLALRRSEACTIEVSLV